jgi:ABC-type proline/glycine betaine transport system substrate-binding protein
MIKAIDIDGRDIEEVVAEWMEANRDIWSSWVPD